MVSNFYILNSREEKEYFSFQKVYRSARRVGASRSLALKIAKTIQGEISSGIKTFQIFKRVKELLNKEIPPAALKFNLKEGMRKLGPAGFHFEKYIGKIFSNQGFKIKINQYIQGKCVRNGYEIDFLAQKNNLIYLGECKYRNLAGDRVDINVCLKNYARFLDIKNGDYFQTRPKNRTLSVKTRHGSYFKDKKFKEQKIQPIIVTNAKFTGQAVRYANCQGIELLGWNYPKNKGLEYLIDGQKLYPITILPSFEDFLMNIFTKEGMILTKDVLKINIENFSKKFKISRQYLNQLTKEAEILSK